LNYLLNCAIHNVTDNCDLLLLAEPENTTDSLLFNGGIPLWLWDMDAICNREIDPVQWTSAIDLCFPRIKKLESINREVYHLPYSARPKCHQQRLNIRV
jgi:hypothetical protein